MYIRWSSLHRLNIGFNPYNWCFMWNRANLYGGSTFVLLRSTYIMLHKSMYVRIINTNFIIYIHYTGSSDDQDEWSNEKVEFSVINLQWWQGVVMCRYSKMLPISFVVYSNIWSLENRKFASNKQRRLSPHACTWLDFLYPHCGFDVLKQKLKSLALLKKRYIIMLRHNMYMSNRIITYTEVIMGTLPSRQSRVFGSQNIVKDIWGGGSSWSSSHGSM